MKFERRALIFHCAGDRLVGVLHIPELPTNIGVVIVVGGPQYRIGSHRQFVHLADGMAAAGFTTLRFDYRGMGDSEGSFNGFNAVDDDLAAAVATLKKQHSNITSVVIWGLCDGATAATFYAGSGQEVAGLVLANPWVRTDAGLARSYVDNYYRQRLMTIGFWQQLLSARIPIARRLKEFLANVRTSRGDALPGQADSLPERTRRALERFRGPVLLLISGNDLTAAEFRACLKGHDWKAWRESSSITRVDLPAADHTFSRQEWRLAVTESTIKWLHQLQQ